MDNTEVEKAKINKILYKALKIAVSYFAMLIVIILVFGIYDMRTLALKIEHGLLCSLLILMLLFLFLPKNYKISLIIFCILFAAEIFLLREQEWRSGTIFGFFSLLVIIPFFETIIIILLSKIISCVNSKYLLYKNYSFLELFARMFLVGIMIIFVMIISGLLRDVLIDKFDLNYYIYR